MDLLANGTQRTGSMPSPSAFSGTPGWFKILSDGGASTLDPDTMNMLLAEVVVNLIGGSGQTKSGTDFAQVAKAVSRWSASAVKAVSGATTLTADDAGTVFINAGSSFAIALAPAASAGGKSLRYRFVRTDTTANVVTIVPSGSDVWLAGGATAYAIQQGPIAEVFSDGVSRWVPGVGGSSTSSLGATGWCKTPRFDSALGWINEIEQWGSVVMSSMATITTGGAAVVVPLAFPTLCEKVWVSQRKSSPGQAAWISADLADGSTTTTGFNTYHDNLGTITQSVGFDWRARGY